MSARKGGGRAWGFPSTQWSIVLEARGSLSDASRAAFEKLVGAYWIPVYWAIRRGWKKEREEAEDLTQEFFVRFIERGGTHGYDVEKGRFRSFLLGALRNFLLQERRDRIRIKRGAGRLPFSLETLKEAGLEPVSGDASPEDVFHREWVGAVLRQAVTELRRECDRMGRSLYFDIFRTYDLGEGERPTYEKVAGQYGLTADEVHTRLRWTRLRLREMVRAAVRETLADPGDVRDEMRVLFG